MCQLPQVEKFKSRNVSDFLVFKNFVIFANALPVEHP